MESALIQWSFIEIDTSKATVSAGAVHSWATLLGFAASSAGPRILELGRGALPLVLWVQGHLSGRKGSAWKLRGLNFPLKPKWHHRQKISSHWWALWRKPIQWSVVCTCTQYHTGPPSLSCKGFPLPTQPSLSPLSGVDHATHAESDLCKPRGAH